MLNANDTEPGYYNVQGTMLIDPAISPDVALVESKFSDILRPSPMSPLTLMAPYWRTLILLYPSLSRTRLLQTASELTGDQSPCSTMSRTIKHFYV